MYYEERRFRWPGLSMEVWLSEHKRGLVFSASGSLYRNGCLYSCGQVFSEPELDGLAERYALIRRIVELHAKWHLNDLRAGTEAQEACLRTHDGASLSFDERLRVLEAAGLLEDVADSGVLWRYGSGWMYRAIDADDLADMRAILDRRNSKAKLEAMFAGRVAKEGVA